MFCLGNPDRRGDLVLQEGLKSDPIRRGGADFFWNNPIMQNCSSVKSEVFLHLTVVMTTLNKN